MNNKENILEIDGLKVIYKTDEETVYAVNGVSFFMGKGETLGIVGETGAGKTTTALSILRILPENTGKITADNVGGIKGYEWSGTLRNCYYLDGEADGSAEGAMTAAQSVQQSTYVGFDFGSIWVIDPSDTNIKTPQLRGNPHRVALERFDMSIPYFQCSSYYGDSYITATFSFFNRTPKDITTKAYAAAYNGNQLVGLAVYDLTDLAPGETVSFEYVQFEASEMPTHLKVICADGALMPIGSALRYDLE